MWGFSFYRKGEHSQSENHITLIYNNISNDKNILIASADTIRLSADILIVFSNTIRIFLVGKEVSYPPLYTSINSQ